MRRLVFWPVTFLEKVLGQWFREQRYGRNIPLPVLRAYPEGQVAQNGASQLNRISCRVTGWTNEMLAACKCRRPHGWP